MTRDLAGKRILITGATGGIGRAIAEALSNAGARLVVTGRKGAELRLFARQLKDALAVPADLTQSDQRELLVNAAVQGLGGLDILVNNAGIGSWGHFLTSSEAIVRQVTEINFFAPIELTRLAVPHLTYGNQPCVVNVASMCGRKAMPAWSEYSASKFALIGMSESWRAEFARFGVDVLTMVPGMTDSGFRANWIRADGKADLKFEKGMTPTNLANGIVKSIRKNKTETVFGSEARRVLLFNRYFPRLTNWLLARKIRKLYS
jgi:short-subunit dehydrogenase